MKYLTLTLIVILIPFYLSAVCIFGKGSTCDKVDQYDAEQEKVEPQVTKCNYQIPFTPKVHYIFSFKTVGECPDIVQSGYIYSGKESLRGVVLKETATDKMSISYKTKFTGQQEQLDFINEKWPGLKDILHLRLINLDPEYYNKSE